MGLAEVVEATARVPARLSDVGDEGVGCGRGGDDGGDEADVGLDVGERVGREGEDGQAGLEDGGEGLHAIGDAGDDEVGVCSEEGSELPGWSKDQQSWRMGRLRAASSGTTSRQYLVRRRVRRVARGIGG